MQADKGQSFLMNEETGAVFVKLSKTVYGREAVTAAAYKFTGLCAIEVEDIDEKHFGVRFSTSPGDEQARLTELVPRYYNELLDEQLRIDLDQRCGELRRIIVEHAFSSSRTALKKKINKSPYILLPFTFHRLAEGGLLLVNQAGEYHFLSPEQFDSLVGYSLDLDCDVANDLKSKQFITDSDLELAINLLATKLRTRKANLRDFTSLHMVVLTCYCNCRCDYCQASSISPDQQELNMLLATARKVVNTIFQSPSQVIKIEFQGGEPTLNWEVLEYIVKYAERVNKRAKKHLEFVLCTNLIEISTHMLRFLRDHGVMISTSLDGPKDLHDKHRISRKGHSTYDAFRDNLERAREHLGSGVCSPLLTITKDNLHRLRDVVDEYINLGFHSIFLRPVNPYGLAKSEWVSIAFPMEEFITAYQDILEYIIRLNMEGYFFAEYYTTLLISRILTPFSTGFVDLQSPAGAGINGVIYDYDGSVYPTDEGRMLARMNDFRFRLGNVNENTYDEIFLGPKLQELIEKSCLETMPGCSWCAYNLYCGGDPVRNYVECGDIVGHRPTSEFCMKNRAIFDHLLSIIRKGNQTVMDVFWSWITNQELTNVSI